MAGRRFLQILALLALLPAMGCAAWCQHHFPQQQCCCQPCCCAPAGYAAPVATPGWSAPATAAPCTCAPGR